MKKAPMALILIAAAAAVFVIARRFVEPAPRLSLRGHEVPEAISLTSSKQTVQSKHEIASLLPAARNDGKASKPSAPLGTSPRSVPALRARAPKNDLAPIRLRFDSQVPPEKDKTVPVMLVVESVPQGWPAEVGEGAQLELLLRLPAGVKLKSEGWAPAELPKTEREDASGPWSLYEKKIPLQLKPGIPPETLLKERIELAVVEEGTNWIITARARLVQGTTRWQAFGVLFATLQGKSGQFHAIPKAPTDIRSAQAS